MDADLLQGLPTDVEYWFVHDGHERTVRLRGAPFFRVLAGAGLQVRVTSLWPGYRGRPAYILASLPAEPICGLIAQGWAVMPDCRIAIDVCFPFTCPDAIEGPGAVAFWTDATHRSTARDALRGVHAVTTPHQQWADDLRDLNPNVAILPDLHPGNEAAYARVLRGLWLDTGIDTRRAT